MKNKFKSYSFWMSVSAAVILVVNNIGEVFGFKIDSELTTKIVDSICGLLILFGIISISKDENKDDSMIEKSENDENDNKTTSTFKNDENFDNKTSLESIKEKELEDKFSMNKLRKDK